jgi:uncharacterized protein (DUF1015 family)
MADIGGVHGLRAAAEWAEAIATPPYDVIKEGSALEARLRANPSSFFHVTLGDDPKGALDGLVRQGRLVADDEPCFYAYEQRWGGEERLGFFAAVAVTPYSSGQVIRHEKTFDEKVKGRIAVTNATGFTLEPIFLLTRAAVSPILEEVRRGMEPLYSFASDFGGLNDLHGIVSRVFRVPASSPFGRSLQAAVAQEPLYIADGHHRYHAALLNGQDRAMAYIVEKARIRAYNRVIRGARRFEDVRGELALVPAPRFETPPKHEFCLYSRSGTFRLAAREVPTDVVGRLDCRILERELYPHLGVDHSMIRDKRHFDYYPEHDLQAMRELVDAGAYDLAVALAPVSLDELMAVADAGLDDPEVVMPEKSTFFAPKILSGLVVHRHRRG